MLNTAYAKVYFIVLRNAQMSTFIRQLTLKRIDAVLDIPGKVVRLFYQGKLEELPMISKYERSRELTGNTDSGYFISGSETEGNGFEKGVSKDEQIVLKLGNYASPNGDKVKGGGCKTEVAMDVRRKLSHLVSNEEIIICRLLIKTNVVASSRHDHCTGSVHGQHHFELKDGRLIY